MVTKQDLRIASLSPRKSSSNDDGSLSESPEAGFDDEDTFEDDYEPVEEPSSSSSRS